MDSEDEIPKDAWRLLLLASGLILGALAIQGLFWVAVITACGWLIKSIFFS